MEKEKPTIRLAQRSVALQRHLNKDKIKEREKEKERNKTKDKEKVMAERHSNAQERRIHELDQNVERFFEVRKVSVDCCYLSIINYRLIDWLIQPPYSNIKSILALGQGCLRHCVEGNG